MSNDLLLFKKSLENTIYFIEDFANILPAYFGDIYIYIHFELTRHKALFPYFSKRCQKSHLNLKTDKRK